MPYEVHSLSFFGKIPTYGDFVRHRASGPGMLAFDDWVQEGLYEIKNQATGKMDIDSTSATPFLFGGQTGPALVGVMGPGQDRVGRQYPFWIAFEKDLGGWPLSRLATLPAVYQHFFQHTVPEVQEAVVGNVEPIALSQRMQDPQSIIVDDASRYAQHVALTPVNALWEALWGYAGDSRKYLLFKNLTDILSPLRGGVPSSFSQVLRFPLSANLATATFEACFWASLCARLLGNINLRPSFFLKLNTDSSIPSSFFLSLRSPSPQLLSCLMTTQVASEAVLNLEEGTNPALAALSIPAHLGHLLETNHLTQQAFLSKII